MGLTIYNLITGLIWSNICIVLFLLLSKRLQFIKTYGPTSLIIIFILAIVRFLFPIEFSFTRIIPSKDILPAIQTALQTESPIFSLSYGEFILYSFILITVAVSTFLLTKTVFELFHQYQVIHRLPKSSNIRVKKVLNDFLIETNQVRNCNIIVSDMVQMPVLTGFFTPTILFPNITTDDKTLKYILLHEWTHFRNRDIWVKLIARVFCNILWWNPFVYCLEKHLNDLLEIKCDKTSTKNMDDSEKNVYAQAIIDVVKQIQLQFPKAKTASTSLSFAGIAGNNSSDEAIINRFELLLSEKKTTLKSKIIVSIFLVILFLISYLFIIQPECTPPVSDSELVVDSNNSYIEKTSDGLYRLYVNDAYLRDLSKNEIKADPHNKLEIKGAE